MNDYLTDLDNDMGKPIEALARNLASVRTGRASPALLSTVTVNVASYGGASMGINQLATVTAPDARMLTVTPWDKSTLSDIEKAIGAAGLGLNPSSDGQLIRVPIPPLTAERRRDLGKQVRQYGEEAKIQVRNQRKSYNDLLKEAEAEKEISQDELNRSLKIVQDATDAAVKKIDDVVKAKEAEILEG